MKIFKINISDLLFLLGMGGVLTYMLSFNTFALVAILGISILTGYILHLPAVEDRRTQVLASVLLAIGIIYYTSDPFLTATFLLGLNFTTLYFQIVKQSTHFLNIQIINVSVMANIIFLSAVQKFRGVNKIEVDNLILTIPVLVLIALAVVMIIKAFYILFGNEKSPASAKSVFIKVLVPFILINALYFSVAYFFYSELGVDLIFLPLISGALAGFCNLTLKANSFTNNILEVFLIAIVPYGISGYAGIALAIITATLFANFVGRIVLDKKPSLKLMTYKMAPLIFLFATTEIRENSGLITRFNLSSGIQIGWLILGAVVLEYFHSILQKLTEIFKNNEIGSFLPFAGTVFTIGLFTIIIKVGNDEAIVSSLVSAIIYLVLLSILDYTRYKNRMRLAYAYANCIGVLSFLILTKI